MWFDNLRQFFFSVFLQLPEYEFCGLNVDKCRYMNSKKLPLWLDFKIADPTSPKKSVTLM